MKMKAAVGIPCVILQENTSRMKGYLRVSRLLFQRQLESDLLLLQFAIQAQEIFSENPDTERKLADPQDLFLQSR